MSQTNMNLPNASADGSFNPVFSHDIENAPLDRRIRFPCYKSFDSFIDVERLRSLDALLTERIKCRIETRREECFLNAYRLEAASPHQPGAREIWLSRPAQGGASYSELEKIDFWQPTAEASNFAPLLDFVSGLPFKATGRILIIYDDAPRAVPAHRDHLDTDVCHEFVWMRTRKKKPFYLLDHKTGEKKYVESYSAWFDSVNQFHGVDAFDGFSFSIRVDGVFTDEFRKQIPTPDFNRASTPALWASLGDD